MAVRKALSKKTRFEIFKRDGFTCRYCGKQPPDIVLVIDHIDPVANGGDNDAMNLVTSCETCNQGKGARLISTISPRPDADVEWLEMQQEISELRRYQMSKKERDRMEKEIIEGFQKFWWDNVDERSAPSDAVFFSWLTWATPDQIDEAIKITASKNFKLPNFQEKLRYCAGCLHNMTGTRKES
jgi:hypothetical protein